MTRAREDIFLWASLPGAKDAAEIVGANFQGGGDVGHLDVLGAVGVDKVLRLFVDGDGSLRGLEGKDVENQLVVVLGDQADFLFLPGVDQVPEDLVLGLVQLLVVAKIVVQALVRRLIRLLV